MSKLSDKYTITTPEDLRIMVSGSIIMIGVSSGCTKVSIG